MAGDGNGSNIRGVLDGELDATGSAPDRGQQAQREIVDQIALQHAREVSATVTHQPIPPDQITTTPSGTGGYHFDAATIAQRITDWKQVLDGIKANRFELEAAYQSTNPPSPDKPAVANALASRASIKAAIDHNQAMQQYAQAWLEALQKTNGTYVEHDQDTGKGLTKAGSVTDGSNLNR